MSPLLCFNALNLIQCIKLTQLVSEHGDKQKL